MKDRINLGRVNEQQGLSPRRILFEARRAAHFYEHADDDVLADAGDGTRPLVSGTTDAVKPYC